ncbi:hypothetical protein MMC28_004524 [Mycoblastus sanguinarius]|nr:hypothetical protein [Mycoblastus sanguinarius]
MSADLPTYKYKTLNPASQQGGEFRLLTLLPSPQDSQINCKLRHVPLDPPPRYEALSYTWGDPKGLLCKVQAAEDPNRTYTIILDDCLSTITYNLEAALQQLRHTDKERTLWVDAICINQANKIEKSEQVRVMGKIYQHADCVLAWLGEHDKYVDLAFDTLNEFFWATKALIYQHCAERCEVSLREVTRDMVAYFVEFELGTHEEDPLARLRDMVGAEVLESLNLRDKISLAGEPPNQFYRRIIKTLDLVQINFPVGQTNLAELAATTWRKTESFAESIILSHHNLSKLSAYEERVSALLEVFTRNYWSRLWVAQELLLAPKVMIICGRRQMNLEFMTLVLLAKTLYKNDGSNGSLKAFIYELDEALGRAKILFQIQTSSLSLASLVQRHSHLLCSEPRDAIYASLSLSPSVNIDPDYGDSIADVYTKATKVMIGQEKNLNIICAAVDLDSSEAYGCLPHVELPTWVPHFESVLSPHRMHSFIWDYDEQEYCAGGILRSPRSPITVEDLRVLRLDGGFHDKIKEAGPRIITTDHKSTDLISVVWNSLQPATWSGFLKGVPCIENFRIDTDVWQKLLMGVYPDQNGLSWKRIAKEVEAREPFESDLKEALPPARLQKEMRLSLDHKAVCTTTKGDLALVLGEAKPGDDIFVARGSTNPLVLRPRKANETYGEVKKEYDIRTFYRFVGASYVHGIMDGEVVATMDKAEGREESVFLI